MNLNDDIFIKYNLSKAEGYLLLAIANGCNNDTINSLEIKGLINEGRDQFYVLMDDGIKVFHDILLTKVDSRNRDLRGLAMKMRELFPKGLKDGKYPYKSNSGEIANKLRILFSQFGSYKDEDILDATQRYAQTMEGSQYMRTLKHFVIKKEAGEYISDLVTFIENKDNDFEEFKTSILI